MGQEFDPYLQWLGISKKEPRPINAYRLLGVDKFESDPDVIAMNGDKQIEHLRKFSSGPQGELAEKLINTLIKAKLTLLKPDRKAAYDQQLRASIPPVAPPAPIPSATPSSAPAISGPAPMSDPAQWNIEAITASPAIAPTRMLPVGTAYPTAPAESLNFTSFENSPSRAAAAKFNPAVKPGKSLTPWIILAASLAACIALTLVLANRHSGDEPVAEKDPAAKTGTVETTPTAPSKKNPDTKKPPAVALPVKAVTPPPEPEPATETSGEATPTMPPVPAEPIKPATKSPTKKPPVAKKSTFNWPPINDPEEQQVVAQTGPGNVRVNAYRYPGTTPRMATIVSRGHTASRWSVEGDELTLHSGASALEFLLFGDPNWTDYTVEFEAFADATNMATPVGVLFRCPEDDEQIHLFQTSYDGHKTTLQTWSPDKGSLASLNNLAGKPITTLRDTVLNPQEWKKYSVTVRGNHILTKFGGDKILENDARLPESGRVGLKFHAYADTKVRVRNIRVTDPNGNSLWDGIPDLPPSLAKAETVLWPMETPKAFQAYPKRVSSGRWNFANGLLTAKGNDIPPLLLTQDSSYENFYLEVKFRKLEGVCDICLRTSDGLKPIEEQRGLRLHMTDSTKPGTPDNKRMMFLQVAMASDGVQLRLNGVTKMQKMFAPGGEALRGSIGFDLTKLGSEVHIEEVLVRKLPESFRLFETRFGPLLGENPAVAANNPPAMNPANNNPNPGFNRNPAPGMPGVLNPDLQPRNTELGELAQKDEDVKKFLDELNKARELANTKIKKFEEDYLKAFDVELNRVRNTNTLNVNDRAELLQVLTEDKKDFETKKRFSLTHGMLPKNSMIGLILAERQKLDRMYVLITDRMLKEKRDDVVLAIKKAREEDPDLRPMKIFSILYFHYQSSTPTQYDFMGDKTVNVEKRDNFNGNKNMVNNPQITWYIDAEKRLNFAGPLLFDRMSIEQIQISLDGRRLVNGKSSTTSTIKSGTIVVD